MNVFKLSALGCVVAAAAFVNTPVWAESDDAMSESEISEIVDDLGGPPSASSDTHTAAVESTHADLEDDDGGDEDAGVDREIGQLGAQDALHESAATSRSSWSPTPEPDYSTPIPEAKPEPWMSKEAKKQVKKANKDKKSKIAKKSKKKSKLAKAKKNKRNVASLKSKKKSKDRRLASRRTHRY